MPSCNMGDIIISNALKNRFKVGNVILLQYYPLIKIFTFLFKSSVVNFLMRTLHPSTQHVGIQGIEKVIELWNAQLFM